MPRRKKDIEGGKIDIGKAFKNLGRDINKKVIKPTERGFQTAGKTLGRITNKELMPAVKSIGIPLASGVAGAVGTMYGGPVGGVMASQLTSGLLNKYVPNQSKNPYVGLAGDALSMGMFGGDPLEQMQLMQKTQSQLSSDIIGKQKLSTKYNPDYPHQDLMNQLINANPDLQHISKTVLEQQSAPLSNQVDDKERFIYSGDTIQGDELVDSDKVSPYSQKVGSLSGMMGGKIKGKRGRPKKIKEIEEIEIYVKKKPAYKKYSSSKNSALEQLLEAKADKEEKEFNKLRKEVLNKQKRFYEAEGYGLKKY